MPNKIFHLWAEGADSVYKEVIEYLKEENKNTYQLQSLSKEGDLEAKFQWMAMSMLLDIYNIAAVYSTKENSFNYLDRFKYDENSTYGIQHLMMVERKKQSSMFVERAIELDEKQTEDICRVLIKRVVSHAIVHMREFDHRQIAQLDTKFYNGKLPKNLMISRQNEQKRIE